MERRDFFYKLGRGAAAAGVATLFPRKAPAAPQKMTLAAVGDCILSRRISKNRDTRFIELAELLRSADCTWGNCEMVFFNGLEGYPAPKAQDLNLICEPWGTDEYNWLGIDVMGIANNHTMDYGIKGLFSTIKNLERVGIAYAGAAQSLGDGVDQREVILNPLTLQGIRVWLRHSLGWEAPSAFAEQLRQTTGGRPAHLQREVARLVENKVLTLTPEGWVLQDDE